jgi:hypothetical protein
MNIDIHSGYKTTMSMVMLFFTAPFILGCLVLIYLENAFSTKTITALIILFFMITVDFLVIKFFKPRSGGFDGKVYYYLKKIDENTIVLTDENEEEDIVTNICYIVYLKHFFSSFISITELVFPKNIQVRYILDGKQIERNIGSIRKRELRRLKGKGIIHIQRKNQLVKY